MAEPFKDFFNRDVVGLFAGHLAGAVPGLDVAGFVDEACGDFARQELKQRSNAIRDALARHLPPRFEDAAAALLAILAPEAEIDGAFGSGSAGVHGWMVQPMADFIALRGMADLDVSFDALAEMTKRFTAEFAVRPFIADAPEAAMARMAGFARDPNMHVRRLASEGCRPRLPWGMQLRDLVADPAPVLPILTALRDDPEEYVRRSVANNLNDIAKDHPDLVAQIAADWMVGADRNRQRLVRHACRSLVKAGHMGALAALGYGPAQVRVEDLAVDTPVVQFGEHLAFSFSVVSEGDQVQPLIVDYIIHHVKADGSRSPKVFKLKVADLAAGGRMAVQKRHAIRPITTRVYYPGEHMVEIMINGTTYAKASFSLEMPPS